MAPKIYRTRAGRRVGCGTRILLCVPVLWVLAVIVTFGFVVIHGNLGSVDNDMKAFEKSYNEEGHNDIRRDPPGKILQDYGGNNPGQVRPDQLGNYVERKMNRGNMLQQRGQEESYNNQNQINNRNDGYRPNNEDGNLYGGPQYPSPLDDKLKNQQRPNNPIGNAAKLAKERNDAGLLMAYGNRQGQIGKFEAYNQKPVPVQQQQVTDKQWKKDHRHDHGGEGHKGLIANIQEQQKNFVKSDSKIGLRQEPANMQPVNAAGPGLFRKLWKPPSQKNKRAEI